MHELRIHQGLRDGVRGGRRCDDVNGIMKDPFPGIQLFLYRLREAGITVPVLAGIMPITSPTQIRRAAEMAGATPPKRFLTLLDYFGDKPAAMEQAGLIYATEQIADLIANRVNGVHLYTMNKPKVAKTILENVSEML